MAPKVKPKKPRPDRLLITENAFYLLRCLMSRKYGVRMEMLEDCACLHRRSVYRYLNMFRRLGLNLVVVHDRVEGTRWRISAAEVMRWFRMHKESLK